MGQGGTVVRRWAGEREVAGSIPATATLVKGDFSPGVDICKDSIPHSPSDETLNRGPVCERMHKILHAR